MGTRKWRGVFCAWGLVLACASPAASQSPFQFYAVYERLADEDHMDVGSLGVAAMSADGRVAAYANMNSTSRRAYLINADGTGFGSYALPSGTGNIGSVAINRTGTRAFFLAGYDQAIFKLEAGVVTRIDLKAGVGLGLPKDPISTTATGDWVYFVGQDTDLWRVRSDGTALGKVVDDALVTTTLGPGYTIWSYGISDDASTIAFILWGYTKAGVGPLNRFELFSLRGGTLTQLTTDAHAKDRVVVSADGTTIVYKDFGTGKYTSIPAAGGATKVLADCTSGGRHVLTRDGGKMVFTDAGGGRLVNAATLAVLDLMPRKLYLSILDNLSVSEDGSHVLFHHEYSAPPSKHALILGHLNDRTANATAPSIASILFTPYAMVRGNPNATVTLRTTVSDANGAADVKAVVVDHLHGGVPMGAWASDVPAYFTDPLDTGAPPDVVAGDSVYSSTGIAGGRVNDFNEMTVRIAARDAAYHYAVADMVLPVLPGSTMAVGPAGLRFAGTNAAGTLNPITGPQGVTVGFTGPVPSPWTATANQPWVRVTNGQGMGSGVFTVDMINPGNVLGSATTAAATITVTASGATNSPQQVTVGLTLRPATAHAAPVGLVDTPVQNATGVQGTIGVTGWVVDDVGIVSVKLYRNCLSFEPQTNCATVAGRAGMVFVGDATIVSGARPDVEAIYATYPQANQAAWGYLLMTNLLPHVPGHLMFGGQGALTFHVLATDVEGHTTWLGRTTTDTTATTFTMANDTIAKPFGAIDTPGQGALTSLALWNFGWVLTPDSNTVADGTDVWMPVTGESIQVYIDGVPQGTVVYNMCRGTTPTPAFCDDDIASIFGHVTPQPLLTPRTGNPTVFRNLDAGRGAIAARYTDTTALANGLHTIAWGVSDTAARGEGIGSRYFRVLNGPPVPRAVPDVPAIRAESVGDTAPGAAAGEVRADHETVAARTGFDAEAPFDDLEADGAGVYHVRVSHTGRLELRLGAVEAGCLDVDGVPRDLPIGSKLDPSTGAFTWAPGVGYLGHYRLVFTRRDDAVVVDVAILADGHDGREPR